MVGTAICEAFLIDFGCYFGFFTLEIISEYFVMYFGFLDRKLKKNNIKTGGLTPCLLTCLLLYLVLCSSFAHTQHSGVDQVDVSPYQAGFQLNWCFCTSFG